MVTLSYSGSSISTDIFIAVKDVRGFLQGMGNDKLRVSKIKTSLLFSWGGSKTRSSMGCFSCILCKMFYSSMEDRVDMHLID